MAKVAFCQDVLVEFAGFMSMAAVLREAGHTVEVFLDEGASGDRLLRDLARFDPDVVGFSLLTPSVPWGQRTARRVREEVGALTVAGNVHVILDPDGVLEEGSFDAVCLGEGELCLRELCDALDRGDDHTAVRGFSFNTPYGIRRNERPELIDMDALPVMERSMYDKYAFFRHSKYLRVCCGRGCPFRCSFCANTNLTDHYGGKDYLRKRSPELAVAEIVQLLEGRPKVDWIFIIDEVLWFDRAWLYEFLELYRDQVGLPFVANLKFNGIREEDIRRMAEAGARLMAVNVETGDEAQRRGILNKPVSNSHIVEVTGWLKAHGIGFGNSVFFGLPGDRFEDHIERIPFFRQLGSGYIWTTFLQPYPGLRILDAPGMREVIPEGKEFQPTFHHDMYMDIEDRDRLTNLKKVYFLMVRFPLLEAPLRRLCQYRIPLLFDVLFLAHFSWYAFKVEHVSAVQMLQHVKAMTVNPALRRAQPLVSVGRPFGLGYRRSAARHRRRAQRRRDRLDRVVRHQPAPTPSVEPVAVRLGPRSGGRSSIGSSPSGGVGDAVESLGGGRLT